MSLRLLESTVHDVPVRDDMESIVYILVDRRLVRKMVIGSQRTVDDLQLMTALAFKELIKQVVTAFRQSVLGLSRELMEVKEEHIRWRLEKKGSFTEAEVEAMAVYEKRG
ncbi:hypothetical protein BT69DRAFT_1291751 [Atractiella rhizophila]|nr:hypothetical protein BT69DRAFT_1291751 [Atractiella rhizophila]